MDLLQLSLGSTPILIGLTSTATGMLRTRNLKIDGNSQLGITQVNLGHILI